MAKIASRYAFPGYSVKEVQDTSRHQIEVGTVTAGTAMYTVHILRPADIAERNPNLPFLVSKVEADGKIWDYKTSGSTNYGILAKVGEDIVVAFVGHGAAGKVEDIVAIADLFAGQPTTVGRKVQLKRGAADFLKRDVQMSTNERRVLQILIERQRAEERQAQAAEHERRQQAREARRREIFGRERIGAFTSTGKQVHGLPVVGDEWMSLDNGTFVMLVESYTDGVPGKILEAFKVKKIRGGNPQKESPMMISQEGPAEKVASTAIKPVGSTIIEIGSDFMEVSLYESMDDIKKARTGGLNGGSYVAVKREPCKKIQVYAVYHDRIETKGEFAPF